MPFCEKASKSNQLLVLGAFIYGAKNTDFSYINVCINWTLTKKNIISAINWIQTKRNIILQAASYAILVYLYQVKDLLKTTTKIFRDYWNPFVATTMNMPVVGLCKWGTSNARKLTSYPLQVVLKMFLDFCHKLSYEYLLNSLLYLRSVCVLFKRRL